MVDHIQKCLQIFKNWQVYELGLQFRISNIFYFQNFLY